MLFEQIFQMFWLCPVASLNDDAPLQLLLWEILPLLGEKTKQGKVGRLHTLFEALWFYIIIIIIMIIVI